MKRIMVAVDGPAGSGKSSVSKRVALDAGLKYIDSGALYRSITWYVLERDGTGNSGFIFTPDVAELDLLQEFFPDGSSRTFVNHKDVTDLIRNETIAEHIGAISDNREVRNFINGLLHKWAEEGSVIIDGRDIGSVVLPDADVKIYLDASIDTRARRRMKEYREKGKNVDEKVIKNQIIQRDEQDRNRPFGALVRSEDAEYIDTSGMGMDEVVARIKDLIDRA